jgi:hypothetical protein
MNPFRQIILFQAVAIFFPLAGFAALTQQKLSDNSLAILVGVAALA